MNRQSEEQKSDKLGLLLYAVTLAVSVSLWLLAIRAPLWLDETVSYWAIAAGVKQIWARSVESLSFPAYFYVLWFTKTVFGKQESVLRIPSVLAMLAASYTFYRCARRLFVKDTAVVATVVFILDGRVAFEAIDVRPYAFAALATTVAILTFMRWLQAPTPTRAATFAAALAGVFYFHYLFGCTLVIAFAAACLSNARQVRASHLGAAFVTFALLVSPVLTRVLYIQKTSQAHVFSGAPRATDLVTALAPGPVPFVVAGAIIVAAALRRLNRSGRRELRPFWLCLALALVPILALYCVSVTTPLHIFIPRYQLVAVPGMALCWGWLYNFVDAGRVKALGCVALVVLTVYNYSRINTKAHGYSWQGALRSAEANATGDGATLVICSDLPDSDFEPMPAVVADSVLFAPLSYYTVASPVVAMPRALNAQAQAIGTRFVSHAAIHHQRFLALAFLPSYPTLQWLTNVTLFTHTAHVLGYYDGVAVVEFDPRRE